MIALLRKSGVALFVLALALVAQIPHAAHVFDRAPYIGATVQPDSAWAAWILAYAYAIALESATLMFVVHGHQRASYGFALASFAVNLSYYAMHGVQLFWGAFPAWLLSALLPIAIAAYSHILTGAQDVQADWAGWDVLKWAQRLAPKGATLHPDHDGGVFIEYPPVADSAQSQPTVAEPMQPDSEPVHDATADDAQPIDARTEALQMHREGMSAAEIARLLQQKEPTVRSWIRRNGATKERA